MPNTSMLPAILGTRPMMVRVSTDLPAPDGTDEAEDFAALDVEIEAVEHLGRAELHRDVANPDDGVGCFRRHRHIPIEAKKIANTPSITMTKKIPFTTDEVVCWPSDSALPCTASPSTQATMPITAAITGALMMPTVK